MNTDRALQPLTHGNILIVGTKASNFDDELRTHPRIIMWDSQNEHWTNKDIPVNVQAIFITRWIGHAAFGKIMSEARKKRITVFNPQGTGIIARQVKELLTVHSPVQPTIVETRKPELKEIIVDKKRNKLAPLMEMIDFNRSIIDNARALKLKADAAGITTTLGSLTNSIGTVYKKRGLSTRKTIVSTIVARKSLAQPANVDVSVQILDEMIKGLTDMRAFIVETVAENTALKARVEKLKSVLG